MTMKKQVTRNSAVERGMQFARLVFERFGDSEPHIGEAELACAVLRHPSMGGATEFRGGLRGLVQEVRAA